VQQASQHIHHVVEHRSAGERGEKALEAACALGVALSPAASANTSAVSAAVVRSSGKPTWAPIWSDRSQPFSNDVPRTAL